MLNKILSFFKYNIMFIILLCFMIGSFLFQELLLEKFNTLEEICIALATYSVFYMGVFGIIYKLKTSKEFLWFNFSFPVFMIIIGLIFKALGWDNDPYSTETIKNYDFVLILMYVALMMSVYFKKKEKGQIYKDEPTL